MALSRETEAAPNLWYTRRGDVVRGPFPAGLVRRYVILGRVRMSDELSQDRIHWARLEDLPALIPDFVRSADEDPEARQRLTAARRWEDERTPRPGNSTLSDQPDRRGPESADGRPRLHPVDDRDRQRARERRLRLLIAAVILGSVMLALAVILGSPSPDDVRTADCDLPPMPQVNWENCAMEGRLLAGADLQSARMTSMSLTRANLSSARLAGADLAFSNLSVADLHFADLRAARLQGANLRASNLSGARLENADLSYADLRNADLAGAQLDGARFDNAIWIDGSDCLPGSVGACFTAR